MANGVSIIICCFNSASLLEQTLLHIAAQNLEAVPECEIILVNNASTDNTQETAEILWAKNHHPKIKLAIFYEGKAGLAFARQKGIEHANYEYMVFCDDDNWLDKNYVDTAFKLFNANSDVAILGGIGEAAFEDPQQKPKWFDDMYHGYAIGGQGDTEHFVNGVYGAGMTVRKSVLKQIMDKCPMFLSGRKKNQLSAGEDSEICLRARLSGHKILYSPKLMFKHFLTVKRLNWAYLKKLHTGFAKSFVVINLYEYALSSGNDELPALYWLKKAAYYGGIYLKYWPKQHAIYSKGDGSVEEIRHITWKNVAINYLEYNVKTAAIYAQIVSFKKLSQAHTII